jgi:hypothetical protein
LRADSEETGLGPKRVPGAGPRPGSGWGTTGPLPAFRTVPRPASDGGSEPEATGPQPAVVAGPVASAGPAADPDAQTPAGAQDADAPTGTFGPFAAVSQPGNGGADAPASPSPVLGAPAAAIWEASTTRGPVIVPPPADDLGEHNRLPIFEAVESDWFRRGRQAVGRSDPDEEAGNGWASAADEGWRAAEVVHAPSSGGVTSAGLPKRVPKANLVPGAAAAAESSTLAPARSAAATRDRFSSFQRGSREGRAAAGGTGSDGGEDEDSE